MKVGYIRVSTQEQNTIRQEVLMQALDVEQVFIDRMSGKNLARPELQKLLAFVRTGDCVIVESISRFARNTRDLLELIERLQSKQVQFVSKKEAIDTTTPTGKFMLTVFGAVAELEREYILQRQREGIAIAKENGVYRFYTLCLLLLLCVSLFCVQAFAVEDMWTAANRIIVDVYNKIAGISTVLAGLMSAVAVVGAKLSNNQHKVDQAWDWLRRIWIAWAVINGIGAFIAYVAPLFQGLATIQS